MSRRWVSSWFFVMAVTAAEARAQLPQQYETGGQLWLTVRGADCCDGRVFTGAFQLAYEVEGGAALFQRLRIDLDDTHLEDLGFLGLGSVDLACAWAEQHSAFAGWLGTDGLIWIDTGAAEIRAASSTERLGGVCDAPTLAAKARNAGPLIGWHDPAGNLFALYGSFTADLDGDPYTLTFTFWGRYLNRPPVARVGFAAASVQEGPCPAHLAGAKPEWVVEANSPLGYKAEPASLSFDPDGAAGRGGILSELWTVTKNSDPPAVLGVGRRLGTVLFELGQRYRVELLVTDHQGATHLDQCTFRVVPAAP